MKKTKATAVFRKEKKYSIDQYTSRKLHFLLSGVLHGDEHNGDDGYMVRSLYFDSLKDVDFYDKEDGLLYRKKIRLRIYSPKDETVKLEMKEKMDDYQRKRSMSISRDTAERLIEGDYACLKEYQSSFSDEIYYLMSENIYRPKCIVEYDRQAFIVKENDTRITLDANIRATEASNDFFSEQLGLYPVIDVDSVTLEVKYNRFLLSYVKDLLDLSDKMPSSVSKYCLGKIGRAHV